MIINVNAARATGQSLPFSFEFDGQSLITDRDEGGLDGPVRAQGSYRYQDGAVYLRGSISAKIVCPCDRCLSPAQYQIDADIDERFVEGGQPDEYGYTGDEIDLGKYLGDVLLLNLPPIVLCEESCKGLCVRCGANQNIDDCGCDKAPLSLKTDGLAQLRDSLQKLEEQQKQRD